MAWLVYIAGRRGFGAQVIYDGVNKPSIGEGIRGLVRVHYRLFDGEEKLSLDELVRRYPPPGAGSPPETPAPVPPSPDTPAPAGATAALPEVA